MYYYVLLLYIPAIMDIAKLAGQQLLKISQSSETGHAIGFASSSQLEHQVIEIDPSKLGKNTFFTLLLPYSTTFLCVFVNKKGTM